MWVELVEGFINPKEPSFSLSVLPLQTHEYPNMRMGSFYFNILESLSDDGDKKINSNFTYYLKVEKQRFEGGILF